MRMRAALAGRLARGAPWGLVAAQSWLLDRVLRRHGQGLSDYDDLQARLARVDWPAIRLTADRLPRRNPKCHNWKH